MTGINPSNRYQGRANNNKRGFRRYGRQRNFIRSANEPTQNSTQRTPLMEVK
jgi:hypothetical protein